MIVYNVPFVLMWTTTLTYYQYQNYAKKQQKGIYVDWNIESPDFQTPITFGKPYVITFKHNMKQNIDRFT